MSRKTYLNKLQKIKFKITKDKFIKNFTKDIKVTKEYFKFTKEKFI